MGYTGHMKSHATSEKPVSSLNGKERAMGSSGQNPSAQETFQEIRSSSTPAVWLPRHLHEIDADELRRHSHDKADTRANDANRRKNVREYTLGEEIANSVTHGIGALLAIAGMALCIVFAVRDGGGVMLAAALIYSISMFAEYLMSTLYHAIAHDRAKRVFKVLDHSFIYLFIAGSYTPYCLVTMAGMGGLKLGAFVWAVAIIGVAVESFWVFRPRWVSAVIYVVLGWAIVCFIPVLIQVLPPLGFKLLLVGGVLYTVGAIFYVLKKIPYMHSVFHVFILAGSIFQFFSILLFVL